MSIKKKIDNKTQKNKQPQTKPKATATNGSRITFIFGTLFLMFTIVLLCSFVSYFTTGAYDQSLVNELGDREIAPQNWVGKLGAWLAHKFIFEGFGIASFLFIKIFGTVALWFGIRFSASKMRRMIFWDLFAILVLSFALGHFGSTRPFSGGIVGYEMNDYLQDYIGQIGTLLAVLFLIIFYLIFRIKMTPKAFTNVVSNTHAKIKDNLEKAEEIISKQPEQPINKPILKTEDKQPVPTAPIVEVKKETPIVVENPQEVAFDFDTNVRNTSKPQVVTGTDTAPTDHHEEFIIETIEEEEPLTDDLAHKIVENFGLFDPTLELSKYQFPTSELLYEHASGGITINQAELEENKNRIGIYNSVFVFF